MSAATISDLRAAAVRGCRRVDHALGHADECIDQRNNWRRGARSLLDAKSAERWLAWADMCEWRARAWSMAAQIQLELSNGNRPAAMHAASRAVDFWKRAKCAAAIAETLV